LFKDFVQLMYTFLGGGANQGEFVADLVEEFVEDDFDENSDGYNPLSNTSVVTLGQYFSGTDGRDFPKKHASAILQHTDKGKFASRIDKLTTDALQSLCTELGKFGVSASVMNVGTVCADLFEQILMKCVNKNHIIAFQKTVQMEASQEIGVVKVPVNTVYVKDGILHVGDKTVRLSDKLTVPEYVATDETTYTSKLCEAYNDAEGSQLITTVTVAGYPKYNRNFSEQRINYYSIIYVIENLRNKFCIDEWSEELELLKEETYDGISDVYLDDYAHGFERLKAVLIQAVNAPITKSMIANISGLISSRERKGVCHLLVNEGKISSWVNVYEQ